MTEILKVIWFHKELLRCLNLNVAKALQSPRMYEVVSGASFHLSHLGLITSPCLNRRPFNDSVLLTVLSCIAVSAEVEKFSSFFSRGSFKKNLSVPLSMKGLSVLLMFPTCPVCDHSLATLADKPRMG